MPKVSMPRCVKRCQVELPYTKSEMTSSGGLLVLLKYQLQNNLTDCSGKMVNGLMEKVKKVKPWYTNHSKALRHGSQFYLQ